DVGHLTQDDFDQGEDKIIAAARREGKSPLAIAGFYTRVFLEDARRLNLVPPESYVRASDHIPEMVALAEKLIKRKHAYLSHGSVYFDVQSFPTYGKLSGNTVLQLKERVRQALKEEVFAQKKHPVDFALWFKAQAGHLLQWPSPWGSGYPGWHIECAAMILKHLGTTVDIHTGGEDHIFPHHENEIAEASAATGKPLARYWMHVRHLLMDGKKMSKREGTFIRLDDLITKGFHPLAFRFMVLGAHYRARLNFTWSALEAAQEGWMRLVDCVARLREAQVHAQNKTPAPKKLGQQLKKLGKAFATALDDDLGTPRALSVLSELVGLTNSYLSGQSSLAILNALLEHFLAFDKVLGLLPLEETAPLASDQLQKINELLKQRLNLRAQKKFAQADQIRKKLLELGFEIQDTPEGTRWVKKTTGQSGRFSRPNVQNSVE
ncbi:MAG: cysteine--tRNA ligase, partial [Parcubacteria group bacterium]